MVASKLEIEEIDDMAETQTVGNIPENTSQEKHPSYLQQGPGEALPHHNECHAGNGGNDDEEAIAVMQHPKRRPGVVNMSEIEESRDHRDRLQKRNRPHHHGLAPLIE